MLRRVSRNGKKISRSGRKNILRSVEKLSIRDRELFPITAIESLYLRFNRRVMTVSEVYLLPSLGPL